MAREKGVATGRSRYNFQNRDNEIEGSTVDKLCISNHEPRSEGDGRTLPAVEHGRAVDVAAAALTVAALAFSPSAQASFLPPEVMDTAAMGLAWFVIIAVPIGAIVLFWMVHVLPEKVAHKRHHPQRDAIQVLCLLSLLFGGLLWPIAWLWAYTKPVAYRGAYGTEKHEDYFHEMGAKAQAGDLMEHELTHLREELDGMATKGTLPPRLKQLRKELDGIQATAETSNAATGGSAKAGSI